VSTETFGQVLRRLRGDLSIRELASRANCGKSFISDMEHGHRHPSAQVAAALDAALEAGGVLIAAAKPVQRWLYPPSQSDAETLANSVATQMSDFGEWVESTNVGAGTLAYLEEQTRRLAGQSLHGPPLPCLMQASELVQRIIRLVQDGHQHLAQRFDLYVIAGKLCALMSWVSSDLGEIAAANAHAHAGRILADQVGHSTLTALLLSAQSKSAFWEGAYREAAHLARHGYDIAGSESARVLLACQEADAWQAQGEVALAKSAMARAHQARDQITHADSLGGPFSCGPAREANYNIAVHLRDHQPQQALLAAERAEHAWRDGDPQAYGTWAQVRIGSALAHLATKEVDGAQESLGPVLDLPTDHRLATLTTRLSRQVMPMLESPPFSGARPALALAEHIQAYCTASGTMPELTRG
jgi:transcriptional regulator with XRE-family HTH domain